MNFHQHTTPGAGYPPRPQHDFTPPLGPPPGRQISLPDSVNPEDIAFGDQLASYGVAHLPAYSSQDPNNQYLQRPPLNAPAPSRYPRPVVPAPIQYPRRYYIWCAFSDTTGETYLEMGEKARSDSPLYSAKLGMSGKMIFRRGQFKHNGEQIGEATSKSLMSNGSVLTLADSYRTSVDLSSKWSMDIRGEGGQLESWGWHKNKQSLLEKLSMKNRGAKFIGPRGRVGATFTDEDDYTGSSKTMIGVFEFHDVVVAGMYGNTFATLALMSWLRMKQRELEKEVVKMIFKLV